MEKRKNINQTGSGSKDDEMREGTPLENQGGIKQNTQGFDDPNQKTNYDMGKGSTVVKVQQASTGKTEEGDEDYDDEDQGKDFKDYNEEYKERNKGMD